MALSRNFAAKFLNVAKNGGELARMKNFDIQIIRDGKPMSMGYEKDENGVEITDSEGKKVPITKFSQDNIHFSKLNNFVRQINAITDGFNECVIKTDLFTVKFKGGRFALKAEKLLQEITEEYFRNKTGMPFVDNESQLFEEVMENFVKAFVGSQTSALNYIALVDVFHKENNAQLRALGKLITVNEETRSLEFSDRLLQIADPSLTVTENEQQ